MRAGRKVVPLSMKMLRGGTRRIESGVVHRLYLLALASDLDVDEPDVDRGEDESPSVEAVPSDE